MPHTVKEIAEIVGEQIIGDENVEVSRISDFDTAETGDIAFLEKENLFDKAKTTNASCLIVPETFGIEIPCSLIKVKNPKLAIAKAAALLHPPKSRGPEIHPSAVIAENAQIGNDVFVGAYVCVGENSVIGDGTQIRAGAKIGDNVSVGKNCVIHPNVFLEDRVTIGDNVILHSGVVVGADGFGYVRDKDKHIKFPQIGKVIIEDNVEIGANSCIDRGSLGETRIGEGTKIDNLCQIAHNVQIGKRVLIAALTGISGSVTIGDDVILAGQVGIADHVTIESGAIIGAKSAVFPGKIVRKGFWAGSPIQPIEDYKKQHAMIRRLARLKEK